MEVHAFHQIFVTVLQGGLEIIVKLVSYYNNHALLMGVTWLERH